MNFYIPFTPERITISLTKRCNLRCIHCYDRPGTQREGNDLSTQEIKDILKQAAEIGVKESIFIGGEPFIREDILELVEFAVKQEFRLGISTNGTLLTDVHLDMLANFDLWFLSFDLNGGNCKLHDYFCGVEGSFEKTKINIVGGVERGLPVTVVTPVCKMNMKEVPDILQYVTEVGARCYTLIYFTPIGAGRRIRNQYINPPEWRSFIRDLRISLKGASSTILVQYQPGVASGVRELNNIRKRGTLKGCSAINRRVIFVDYKGDVFPCSLFFHDTSFSLGNLTQESLYTVINQKCKIYGQFANLGLLSKDCQECRFLNDCRGGCRGFSFSVCGNWSVKDPRCVKGYIPCCPFEIISLE